MGPEKFFVPYDGRYPNHEATHSFSIRTRAYIPGLLHDLPTHCLRQRAFRPINDAICIWGRPRSQLSRLPPRNARSFDAGQGCTITRVPPAGLKRFQVTALATLNQATGLANTETIAPRPCFATEFARRLIAESRVKDAYQRRLDFPQLRVGRSSGTPCKATSEPCG